MTDRNALEDRIRASLQQRAQDVQPTPALWQRVDRKISRRGRWQIALGVLAGAAAVLAAVLVVPTLFEDPGLVIDPDPVAPDGGEPGPAAGDVALVTTDGPSLFEVDPATGEALRELVPFADPAEGFVFGSVAVRPSGDDLTVAVTRQVEGNWDVDVYVFGAQGEVTDLHQVAGSVRPPDAATPPTVAWSPDGAYLAWTETTPDATAASVRVQPWTTDGPDGVPAQVAVDGFSAPDTLRLEGWTGTDTATLWLSDLGGDLATVTFTPSRSGEIDDTTLAPVAFEGGVPVDVAHLAGGTTAMLVADPGTGQDAESAGLRLVLDPMSDTQRDLPLPDGFPTGTAGPGEGWLDAAGTTLAVGFGPQGWVLTLTGDVVEELEVAGIASLPDGTLAAGLAPVPSAAPAPDPGGVSGSVDLERDLITSTPDGREVEVETVRVTGGVPDGVAASINDAITAMLTDELTNYDDRAAEAEASETASGPPSFAASLTVDRAEDGILSLAWQVTEYLGGANTNGRWLTMTRDLATGAPIRFDAVFVDGARDGLVDPVAQAAAQAQGPGAGMDAADIARLLRDDPLLLDQFTLRSDAVVFRFDEYAIAPGAAGPVAVVMSAAAVEPWLAAGVAAQLDTAPPDTVPADGLPSHAIVAGGGGLSLVDRAAPDTPVAAWTRPAGVDPDAVLGAAIVRPGSTPDDVSVVSTWWLGDGRQLAHTRIVDGQVVTNAALPVDLQGTNAGGGADMADTTPVFLPDGAGLVWLESVEVGASYTVRMIGWDDDGPTGEQSTVGFEVDEPLDALVDVAPTGGDASRYVLAVSYLLDTASGHLEAEVEVGADGLVLVADSVRPVEGAGRLTDAGHYAYPGGVERYGFWATEGGPRYGLLDAPSSSVDVPVGLDRVVAFGPTQVVVTGQGRAVGVFADDGATQTVDLPDGTVALLPWGT